MRGRGVSPYQLPLPFTSADRQRMIVMLPPTPYERGPVMRALRDTNKIAGPVTATRLAELIGISERTTRLYLRRLEFAGLVQRPCGPRSGWAVM